MRTITFSAALLAGGQSRRMGRDKALLPHPEGGLFWERQLRVLEALQPEEIFWSGSPRENLPPHIRIVPDAASGSGPLGGLAACLDALTSDLLLVLAVDLPYIRSDFFLRLMTECTPTCGTVVKNGSFYEPLAAIYPRAMRDLAARRLAAGELSLQPLLHEAEEAGLIQAITLEPGAKAQLRNVNSPGDLPL